MSQLYHLHIADEHEAQQIVNEPGDHMLRYSVPAFDECKQLTLLSMFCEVADERPALKPHQSAPDFINDDFVRRLIEIQPTYYKHFQLLYPAKIGAECFVTRLPDQLVSGLANVAHESLTSFARRWIAIEPSFEQNQWTDDDVTSLLSTVIEICRKAIAARKSVLFRFSL